MQKLLKEAFRSCIQTDTHATESGLTVSVAKRKNEIILFVKTDNDHARKHLEMPENDKKSCDRLILYAQNDNKKNELLCLLELKGKKLEHAVNQIINTHKYFLILIEKSIERHQRAFLIVCACICMHNSPSSLREEALLSKKLKHGMANIKIKHGIQEKYDIGDFLRESYQRV